MILFIPTPGTPLQLRVDVVVPGVPLLIGLDILSRHGLNVLIATDEITSATEGWSLPLNRQHGHLALRWQLPSRTWYTRSQLLRLHKHLAHPSPNKLLNLLSKSTSNTEGPPPGTTVLLNDIARSCHACQVYASRRVTFSVRDVDHIIFNHEVRMASCG
jgi:hypothetical protein